MFSCVRCGVFPKYKYCSANKLKYFLRKSKNYSKTKFIHYHKRVAVNKTSLFETWAKRNSRNINICERTSMFSFKRSKIYTVQVKSSSSFKPHNVFTMKSNFLNRFLSGFLATSDSIYLGEAYLTGPCYFCYVVFESLRLIRPKRLIPWTTEWTQLAAAQEGSNALQTKEDCKRFLSDKESQKKRTTKWIDNSMIGQHIDNLAQNPSKEEENIRRPRPNYFVAVQISNTEIHANIKEIQDYILTQDRNFDECMIPLATLHITLMVMNISNQETYDRAQQALTNVHKEQNEIMCKTPLLLEFCGLSHFRNRVVYGKIKENHCLTRLCQLAKSVEKHFSEVDIFSTDHEREFNPHLTIAKIKFPKKNKKRPNKFSPRLYEKCMDNYLGVETVRSIQLLRMDGPKDLSGYYKGYELMFNLPSPSLARIPEITEKKRKIREKVAENTMKICKSYSKEAK